MGHGYPLPSADSAIENSVDGDPVSCNCDKPWYNQGPGCYVALSGFIAGVSPDPTANFLQVSGTCDATASLQQTPPSRIQAGLQQTPPSLMSRSVVAPAPAPPSAFIQYYRVPNHADIAAWPASVGFSTGGPDARTIVGDTSGKQPRCYARERVPAPGTFVRNFFGCYEGNLMAAEGCAPVGTSMGHGYPLPSADAAIENSVDGDPVSCNCDKPWYNQGPGCYVALSGFIAGVSPDPTANFLQVSGTCDATASLQQEPPSRTPASLQQTPPSRTPPSL